MTRGMIALIFDLGIRLATFAALAAAFFRRPGAGLRGRNRAWGSVVAIPCCFPAGPRGRETFFPAGRTKDLAQAIDYTRDYRQNRADFGAETKILPDLREARAPARLRSCRARGCRGRGRGPPILASPGSTSVGLRRRRRVDHAADLGDLVRRKAAAPGVLVNDRLVVGKVDAKGLVGSDVALDPLDLGTELLQGRVRLLRRLAQSLPFGAVDRRQLAFDDELAHGFSFQRSSHAIVVALLATAKISARARRRLASRRRSAGLIRNAAPPHRRRTASLRTGRACPGAVSGVPGPLDRVEIRGRSE